MDRLTDAELCKSLNICPCNLRFEDEIRSTLIDIRDRYNSGNEFTDSQMLILALLDSFTPFVTHGVNIKYHILLNENEFWNKL